MSKDEKKEGSILAFELLPLQLQDLSLSLSLSLCWILEGERKLQEQLKKTRENPNNSLKNTKLFSSFALLRP